MSLSDSFSCDEIRAGCKESIRCYFWGLMKVRARSKQKKDFERLQIRLIKRIERRRMFDAAFWDRERAETVALGSYPFLNVGKGEVLFDKRGYLNPSLRNM